MDGLIGRMQAGGGQRDGSQQSDDNDNESVNVQPTVKQKLIQVENLILEAANLLQSIEVEDGDDRLEVTTGHLVKALEEVQRIFSEM